MKVALVHDYLTEYGGAERVLEAIHELWPEAPVYAVCNKNRTQIDSSLIHSVSPSSAKLVTPFLPLAFENIDLRNFDVIISDGTIWSKGVLTTPDQLHIFYCHTPPRFLYHYESSTKRNFLMTLFSTPLENQLRMWDWASAQRPDYIIANSKTTTERIKKFWGREAEVIYPPVDLHNDENKNNKAAEWSAEQSVRGEGFPSAKRGRPEGANKNYFLIVSRLVPYKNIDIAIEACNKLKLPLKIVGTGPKEKYLKSIAGETVEFCGFANDENLSQLYKNCRALIFPTADEDFGIVPVEAMAYGKPVIALRSGGVTETVVEGKTGIFFDEPTVESLTKVLKSFDEKQFDPKDCTNQAQKFSKTRFQTELKNFVETHATKTSSLAR